MSKFEKIWQKILDGKSDANISFEDLRNLLLALGFAERNKGKSSRLLKRRNHRKTEFAARWR